MHDSLTDSIKLHHLHKSQINQQDIKRTIENKDRIQDHNK